MSSKRPQGLLDYRDGKLFYYLLKRNKNPHAIIPSTYSSHTQKSRGVAIKSAQKFLWLKKIRRMGAHLFLL